MALRTPVLFCLYNRPETTRRVFEAIRRQQPRQLFVIQDGPREGRADDARLIAETRDILESVDWPCSLRTDFASVNLGCKRRMASGISWAFQQAEQLIILEDDCLPGESFFGFCETLLNRYARDDRVMMISGDNFQEESRSDNSYYFSKWTHIWGWASWRRAWSHCDIDMTSWPEARHGAWLRGLSCGSDEWNYWMNLFQRQYSGEIDTWDFPWMYSCWARQGLTILPDRNLVTNIGFGLGATHTTDSKSRWANMERREIGDLRHPRCVERDRDADAFTWHHVFKPVSTPQHRSTPPRRRLRLTNWWRGWRLKKGAACPQESDRK